MTAYVNHEATVGEAGLILHRADGQGTERTSLGDGECLVEGLRAEEDSCLGGTLEENAIGCHIEHVAFGVSQGGVQLELDAVLATLGADLHLCTGHLTDILGQEVSRALHLGVVFGIADGRGGADDEGRYALSLRYLVGQRYNLVAADFILRLTASHQRKRRANCCPHFEEILSHKKQIKTMVIHGYLYKYIFATKLSISIHSSKYKDKKKS